jgi:hypothetical protein
MENQGARPTYMRSYGLGRNFSRAAKVLLTSGAILLATGLMAESAFASPTQPILTATSVTFQIPSNPKHLTFKMELWAIESNGPQRLIGQASGRSGELYVRNRPDKTCDYQVDVFESVHLYVGFKQQLAQCSNQVTTTTTTTSTTTTSTTMKVTTTTAKPKTTGSHGGTTTTVSTSSNNSGPATKSATSVPPSALAFTGTGPAMWILVAVGGAFILGGAVLLGYTRRYRRVTPVS